MLKVNFYVFIALTLVPNLVFSASAKLPDSYLKALRNTRRISPSHPVDFFFSGLYNTKGKDHDLGSDFGLTSDVYTKLNPFYTKNKKVHKKSIDQKKPEPVYYPVYNHSVTQDASGPDETYDVHSNYDSKHVSSSYSAPSSSYGQPSYSVQSVPSSSYGQPSYSVQSVPSSSYGEPSSSYGSPGGSSYYPSPSYGSPATSYGSSSYYPSSTVIQKVPEAQKSHSEWFLAKLMKKFDLILVSKILLKLIIFKKIVKFIGIICLLLFIPILKKKFEEHTSEDEEDEEGRRIQALDAYANVDFHLKEITNFALTAVEGFSYDNIPWCVGESVFYCRLQYMLDTIDLRYPSFRIMNLWFPKLATTTTTAAPSTTSTTTYTQRNFDEGTVDFNDFITESPDSASAEDSSEDNSEENRLEKFDGIFRRR